MLDLLALLPTTPRDWAMVAALVLPWLAGVALIITAVGAGLLALARAVWRAARRTGPEPPVWHKEEQLLAALATATRERDMAHREAARLRHRLAAQDADTIHLPRIGDHHD